MKSNMDLNSARLFISAVQAGSFSGAATRAEVPLATISRRIRELERQLGVQLLERSTRGIKLTDAGTKLYEQASRGLELMAEGEELVRSDQRRLRGRLRLSIPPGFEPWWTLLAEFQKQYPEIQIAVFSTERRVDLAQDGIDVALRIGTLADESMVAKRLFAYRHVLVAAPSLLKQLGTPKSPEDMHRFPCGTWASSPGARSVWRLGEEAFSPEPIVAGNDYLMLRQLALKGEIVTELPPFLAQAAIAQGTLKAVLPKHPLPEQSIHLLYPSHRHPSSLVRAYLNFCVARGEAHVFASGKLEE